MICPFRINRETIYYGCEPRNCTVHEWFEDCEETDCPFFNEESGCMRVKAEYVLDVQEGILKKTEE